MLSTTASLTKKKHSSNSGFFFKECYCEQHLLQLTLLSKIVPDECGRSYRPSCSGKLAKNVPSANKRLIPTYCK